MRLCSPRVTEVRRDDARMAPMTRNDDDDDAGVAGIEERR
jgi:hypothetical protein